MNAKDSKAKIVRNIGKGAKEEELPSRFAKAQLTGGDLYQRTMNNYSKKAKGLSMNGPSIFSMGRF